MFNVGMIRVYRLKCDSLEMFSVCECNDVPRIRMYLYVGLSATSLEMFSMAHGAK